MDLLLKGYESSESSDDEDASAFPPVPKKSRTAVDASTDDEGADEASRPAESHANESASAVVVSSRPRRLSRTFQPETSPSRNRWTVSTKCCRGLLS